MAENKPSPTEEFSKGMMSEGASTGLGFPTNKVIPGLILIGITSFIAYGVSLFPAAVDALALALVLGIAARIVLGDAEIFKPGAQLGIRIFLPLGIILYGLNLDFSRVLDLPIGTITLTLLCMVLFYVVIFWFNTLLWKLNPKLSELTASGSAVCGASAIAVLSPGVESEPEDTSVALLVVTAIGLLGVMTYPLIKEILGMPDILYAIFSGATLHEPGFVQVATSSYGGDIVNHALAVKTIRIVMLAPIALVTGFLHRAGPRSDLQTSLLALRRVWFVLPFVLLGLLISFVPAARVALLPFRPFGTLVFALALSSIGFMVDIESVLTIGFRPLVVGFIGWVVVVIFFITIAPLFL